FPGDHRRGQPAPEAEDMRQRRMEVDAAVGLAAVQVQGHREDGQLGGGQEVREKAPETGLDEAAGEEVEQGSGHGFGGMEVWLHHGARPWRLPSLRGRTDQPGFMSRRLGAVPRLAPGPTRPHAAAMPELPEVETTRRGLAPHVEGRRVLGVVLRRPYLRWPIPAEVGEY